MLKPKNILGLFIVLLGIVMYHAVDAQLLKRDNQIRQLQISLAKAQRYQPVSTEYIRETIQVATTEVVTVDKTDYKKQLADKELIKDLRMRLSQVQSEHNLAVVQQDSVRLQPASDSVMRYKDHWVDFQYNLRQATLQYAVRDSLTTFVERKTKHRFLWMRWGTRGYEVKVVNHNPHASLLYNSFISVD